MCVVIRNQFFFGLFLNSGHLDIWLQIRERKKEEKRKEKKNNKVFRADEKPTELFLIFFLCRGFFFKKKKDSKIWGVFYLGEQKWKKKNKKSLRCFSLKINRIILSCRSSFSSSEGGRIYAVFFFFSSSQRLRVERREKGGQDRPDSRPQFGWPAHASRQASDRTWFVFLAWAFQPHYSRPNRTMYMYVSAKPGSFGGGGVRYHVTVCARLLGYCIYVYLGSHTNPLEDFPPRGVCAAIDEMQRLRVRGRGFLCPSSLRLSVHGWLKMRIIQND